MFEKLQLVRQEFSLVNPRNDFRKDIQGIRALAILAVVLFHLNKDILPGGFIGVDIFFVISGYIITSISFRDSENQRFSILSFYKRRFHRIIPAYFFMLATTALLSSIIFIEKDFEFFFDSLRAASYFNSNNYFSNFSDYFAPETHELPLVHTWSLALEMQFYFLFPWLFILLQKQKKYMPALLVVGILTLVSLCNASQDPEKLYYSLLLRTPEFLLGVIAACITYRIHSNFSLMGAALIISSFFVTETFFVENPFAIYIACVGMFLILISNEGIFNRALSRNSLYQLGELSFSIYLWHWPLLAFFRYCTGQYELSFAQTLLFLLLLLSISVLSYRFVETVFRKSGTALNTIRTIIFVSVLASISIFFPARLNKEIVVSLPIEYTRYHNPQTICHGQLLDSCLRGRLNSENEVLVIGDSHAAQLNIFFDVIGNKNNFRANIITGSSCVTIPDFDVKRIPLEAQSACKSQIEITTNLVPRSAVIVLAASWQYHTSSAAFMSALESFFEQTAKNKQRVIVLAQVPMLNSNVLRVVRLNELGIDLNIQRNGEWLHANEQVKALASRYPNIIFSDFSKIELFDQAPFYKGELIYHDNSHLNEVGSRYYGEVVSPYFLNRATLLDGLQH